MFKNSDEKLFKFVNVFKSAVSILAFLLGALAIFNIVVGGMYGQDNTIINGVVYLIVALFVPILGYTYIDFVAMLSYDLKTIRNKLYDIENKSLENSLQHGKDGGNSSGKKVF